MLVIQAASKQRRRISHVRYTTSQTPSSPVLEPLGEAEVGELEMAVLVEQEILGLEVAVDDGQRVEVVERRRDLGGVEETRAVGELAGVAQVGEQLAAAQVLEQHVQVATVVVRPQPDADIRSATTATVST